MERRWENKRSLKGESESVIMETFEWVDIFGSRSKSPRKDSFRGVGEDKSLRGVS